MKEIAGCRIYKNSKLLLLHRTDKNHWELPGGKVKQEEKPEEAAKRETKEEIGCEVEIIEYICHVDFEIKGEKIKSHQFKARIINGVPGITEPETFDKIDYVDINKVKLAPNIR